MNVMKTLLNVVMTFFFRKNLSLFSLQFGFSRFGFDFFYEFHFFPLLNSLNPLQRSYLSIR